MSRNIMLLPLEKHVGLTTISLGLIKILELKKGSKTYFFQPISNTVLDSSILDQTLKVINAHNLVPVISCVNSIKITDLFKKNRFYFLYEKILNQYPKSVESSDDIVLVEGLKIFQNYESIIYDINFEIAAILNAEIVFLSEYHDKNSIFIRKKLKFIYDHYLKKHNLYVSGIIFNKVHKEKHSFLLSKKQFCFFNNLMKHKNVFLDHKNIICNQKFLFPIIASIPWNDRIAYILIRNFCNFLECKILNQGQMDFRVIKKIFLLDSSILNFSESMYNNSIFIVSYKNKNLLYEVLKDKKLQEKISVLLLTNVKNIKLNKIQNFLQEFIIKTLTVVSVSSSTMDCLSTIKDFGFTNINKNCIEIQFIQNFIFQNINKDWINALIKCSIKKNKNCQLLGSMFVFNLFRLAASFSVCSRIIFPEGNELRIIKAVNFCSKNKIAKCILLGKEKNIHAICRDNNINLHKNIKIINPSTLHKEYAIDLFNFRKHKGMNVLQANRDIKDNITLGTLMLKKNKVDGLVAGSVNTTANTIRPGLQLIKTLKTYTLISSAFFMVFSDKILIFSDCAINVNPSADELSEIAVQSAESALLFGIVPKIAMISYSTGESGSGDKVEIVKKATNLVRLKRPDLIVDGPMQYDAAVCPDVAKIKAPNSLVAGQATVLIFPDLNTGNTTYKAVQRTANILSIGPIIQGMNKPINDLSRGASVEDIIYTIVITAIQSSKLNNNI